MDEIIFSETSVPMPTGETTTMNSTAERRITIEAVDQAAFEEQESFGAGTVTRMMIIANLLVMFTGRKKICLK